MAIYNPSIPSFLFSLLACSLWKFTFDHDEEGSNCSYIPSNLLPHGNKQAFAEDWPRGYGEELISHHHHRHRHHHRPTEQEFQQCFSSLFEIRPCVQYIAVSAFSFNFNADEASDCCDALMDIPEECFACGERRLHWVKDLCKSFLPAPPVLPSRHKPRHKPSPSAPTPPSPSLPKPSPSTPTRPSKSPPAGLFAEYPTEP